MLLLSPSCVHATVNTPAEATAARVARLAVAGSLPRVIGGSASALPFSRPAQRSLRVVACTLAEPPKAVLLFEVLQSVSLPPRTAPIAPGWSDSCRTGFAPAGKQRLPRRTTAHELGSEFDLERILNHGYLPRIYESGRPAARLDAYVSDYLREEIAAEGLVRNLPSFSDFLDAAALSDGGIVSYTNIARDCGVSNKTVKEYFQILEDTLIGSWLPAYRKRVKRRLAMSPKFYFADVGVVNSLARRGKLRPGSELFGKAFENWVHHELRSYLAYSRPSSALAYWRLPSGLEVDFMVDDMDLAVEAKASSRIHSGHLRGLRALAQEMPHRIRRVVVCLEPKPWRTDDGIAVLPAPDFVERLWGGRLTESRG